MVGGVVVGVDDAAVWGVLVVSAGGDCWVAHLCAQRGVGAVKRRLDYVALGCCLITLEEALPRFSQRPTVVMPRIGCGLAGGDWAVVQPLLERRLPDSVVYSLPREW